MKKLFQRVLSLLLAISTMLSISIYCLADSINISEDITVIYQENSTWTDIQKEQFIELIMSEQTNYTPYSLLCLFGHDETTEYHCVVKHKALSVAPRCAVQYYEVITCSRCDYMDATLVSQAFIDCCPED